MSRDYEKTNLATILFDEDTKNKNFSEYISEMNNASNSYQRDKAYRAAESAHESIEGKTSKLKDYEMN